MNKKINFQDANDLNISNSTDKELNDILTEDLLSYSEDISKSNANQHQNLEKNKITNNKNNSEITISFLSSKNKSESQKCTKSNKNDGKENNNKMNLDKNSIYNGSNKDLSVLQISLSNLLSDIDSKDLLMNQINKSKEKIYFENNSKNEQKKFISNQKKQIIKLQNENDNLIFNNNKNIVPNDNNNNKINNTNENIYVNNINNNIINVGNNFIINSNLYNQDKLNARNSLKLAKNKYIYNEYNIKEKINNKLSRDTTYNKNIKSKYNINTSKENIIHYNTNNGNVKMFTPSKFYYQIEKGENFQLSMDTNTNTNTNINHNLIYNNINNYKIQSILSINKTQNFTIDSICFEYNNCNKSEIYDLNKKNNITMSMKIIKEILKNNKINEQINNHINNKNKIKLINNKNLVILKDESKRFFYNPKIKYNTHEIFYPSKNDFCNKAKFKLNIINNSKIKIPSSERNIKNDKKLILRNFNQISKNKNKNKNRNITISNINPKNSQSFQKSILPKGNLGFKMNNSKEKRNSISEYNSYNNSSNKKKKNSKIKINSKINNKINNKKISFKTTLKNKNENVSEPIIKYYSNTNSKTNHLISQIKLAQKKTTNKLLNNLTNLNNINKGTLFPLFSKIFLQASNKKNVKEDISNSNPNKDIKNNIAYKTMKICKTDNNKNKYNGIKVNKNKCFTDDISINKDKKNKKDRIHYKRINRYTDLSSLINSFNNRGENNNKNNKSLINLGGLYFINQNQALKKGETTLLSSNFKERNKSTNRGKLILSNDNDDKSNLNTLNYSLVKNRPQIINDFSNYKKKGDFTSKFHDKSIEIKIEKNSNFNHTLRRQRIETDINNSNYNNKNHINVKRKKRDSFKKKI